MPEDIAVPVGISYILSKSILGLGLKALQNWVKLCSTGVICKAKGEFASVKLYDIEEDFSRDSFSSSHSMMMSCVKI